jgi:ubiquitin C-terminal hydrolase
MYSKKHQQDASELYRFLIAHLIDAEDTLASQDDKFTPLVKREYLGISASQVFCLHCDYRNLVFSPFSDLQLSLNPHSHSLSALASDSDDLASLSKDPHSDSKRQANERYIELKQDLDKVSVKDHVSIQSLHFEQTDNLKDYLEKNPEAVLIPTPLNARPPKSDGHKGEGSLYLEDIIYNNFREDFLNNQHNFYICSSCNSKQKITEHDMRFIIRKSFIASPPPRLCITFKRFKKSQDNLFSNYTKNSAKVIYPLQLDISPIVIKPSSDATYLYELEAVVNHSGNLQSGHYTAYVQHVAYKEKAWFYFSDQFSKQVDEKDVLNNANAFMLFYRRIVGK